MTTTRHSLQRGFISGHLIAIIGLLVVVVGMAGLSAWLYLQYDDQKTNVDGKVNVAVAEAKKEQADWYEQEFEKRENVVDQEFAGPEDYGRLSFKYPKKWSVYVGNDGATGGRYLAYLHPTVVPPTNSTDARFALRVTIEDKAYDQVLNSYRNLIQKGDLKSNPITVNEHDGTRLDGNFSKDIRGAVVLFKVRDKTITVQTDADNFKTVFEDIIKTIDFNT